MTQLDLPQVSMQRYFDLLKRRRWQVVPVSLLGLLVGGVVAFLIPRYFVAQMDLTYQNAMGEVPVASRDPGGYLVENAKLTIPDAVGDTLALLGWTDYSALPPRERHDYERGLRERLDITDVSGGSRERPVVKLHLTYKDRDGQRAKTFLETLVATWVARELDGMRDKARARVQDATTRLHRAQQAFENANKDLKECQLRNDLPDGSATAEQEAVRTAQQRRVELEARIRDGTSKQRLLQTAVDALEREIELTPAKTEGTDALAPELLPDPANKLALEVQTRRKAFELLRQAHPDWATRKRELEAAEALLQQVLERMGIAAGQNPRQAKLRADSKLKQDELRETELDLQQARTDLQQLELRQRQLTEAFAEMRERQDHLQASQRLRDGALTEVTEASKAQGQLNYKDVITYQQAWVPPAPTDPNILLVALIGCVIGLGVAIGLILAIDLLQGTYKTIDDVERGLSVPVLGGMSHIETEEHRHQVAGSRKRASLFAGSFVVLMVVVVTWYYREPTSLPPFVRDLLAMVLGEG